mgnify:CR=1 FL=1
MVRANTTSDVTFMEDSGRTRKRYVMHHFVRNAMGQTKSLLAVELPIPGMLFSGNPFPASRGLEYLAPKPNSNPSAGDRQR